MARTLLQLQWDTYGYYSPDGGKTFRALVKPDHRGGFLVSYGRVNPYGFVPFRPQLVDMVFDVYGMGDEYVGAIPTNTETTLVCINALLSYLYYVLSPSSGYEVCDDVACPVLIDDENL